VRYKQTAIGITWTIIHPLLTMIVLTIIFGNIDKLPSDDIAYPLLVLAGTLPSQLFASSLTESSNSLVTNTAMISKNYFPRLVLPVGGRLYRTLIVPHRSGWSWASLGASELMTASLFAQ